MAITVSTTAQLLSALSSAKGGETILLAAGNYGSLELSGKTFSSDVTIKSANADKPATFTGIALNNCSNLSFDSLNVNSGGNSGQSVVGIQSSRNIDFVNSEISGKVDAVYPITGPQFGVYVSDGSSDINISGNYVHDVLNGVANFGTSKLTLSDNTVDRVGSDAFKFSGVDGALIEGNTGPTDFYPSDGAHADFMQFQGAASSDLVIRGNVLLLQNQFHMQGIFVAGNGGHKNVLIEDNVIYTQMGNGILVTEGTNVVIRDNTLINTPDAGNVTTSIRAPGATLQNNIYTSHTGSSDGSNVIVQNNDPKKPNYIGDILDSLQKGEGITLKMVDEIHDRFGNKGATDLVNSLLKGGGSPVTPPTAEPAPQPTPKPTPEPSPEPAPDGNTGAGLKAVYALNGAREFSGKATDVVHVKDGAALDLKSGTISFTFEADSVSGRHALVSKDAANYKDGGHHFSTWIKDGVVYVRFEDGKSGVDFKVPGVKANTAYDFTATFEPGKVAVYLDDKLIGTKDFTMDWTKNTQDLEVGGLGWTTKDAFDGTISNVKVIAGAHSPADLAEPAPAPQPSKPAPVKVEPAPAPAPVPSDDDISNAIYKLLGDHEFNGKAASVINAGDSKASSISEGSIAFTFDADSVSGKHALVSKDGANYVGGGNHFSSWVEDGTLHVQFEDKNSGVEFAVKGIKADKDYAVIATFDEDQVGLYVNDTLIGTKDFTTDWTKNTQDLEVGGFSWTNKFAFDGTISDVGIFDSVITPNDYDYFAAA